VLARSFVGVFVASLLLAAPAAAVVEPPATVDCAGQDATACGRLHFEAGTAAFEKADYPLAAAEFRAALEQRPHPVIRFNLALSLARLGQPSAAIEQLRQVLADPSTDKELKERAQREQKSAEQAQARVTFRLSDPSRERVELDGKLLPTPLAGELAIDPGPHHVKVISGSSIVLDQELELVPGERVELRVGERSRRIDVVVIPPDQQPAAAGKDTAQAQAPAPSPRKLAPVWFYSAAGVTVALAGVSVWSGLDTQSAFEEYERELPRLTQAQANARVSDGHARELRTNLLLGGALLAGAGTAVLGIWFTDFGGGARAHVGLTPGQVALSGRF
jgi:hypothetical protein